MNRNHLKSLLLLGGVLCAVSLGSAYAEDNTTNIISGTTVDYGGGFYAVGYSGTNNYLQIDSGGQLNNCVGAVFGDLAGASNNNALVTGSGSAWNITGSTYVGFADGNNSLVISNGGYVTSGNAADGNIIGYGTNSANNSVLVTGAGSTWDGSSTQLIIGNHGSGNILTVANGGTVYVPTSSYLFMGSGTAATNNHLLITDPGSTINEGTSGFFETSSGNTVVITNGGAFYGSGSVFFGIGGSHNTNTITGAGSTWDQGTTHPFWLGYYGTDTGNVLNVLNGAYLRGQVVTAGANGVFNLGDGSAAQPTANLFYVNLATASARMNFNNGVLQPDAGIQTLIFGSGSTYIQSGGAVIDVTNSVTQPSGITVGIKNNLLEDPASTGGGLTKIGVGYLFLAGTNTYTGATTVSNGTFLMDGLLPSSTVTLISGTTLGGKGTIGTPVTIPAGTTLQPRDFSTLTITNTLNLAGTTVMSLNRTNAQNASKISGVTTLTLGGTLTVVNANTNSSLQLGDTFTLFSASTVSGSFATTNLPSLGAGLQWNFSGTVLTVAASVNPNPTNIVFGVSGGNLTLSWPADHLGWYAQSNSVSLTITNDWFDIAGSQTATNLVIPIQPGMPKVFYRLRL